MAAVTVRTVAGSQDRGPRLKPVRFGGLLAAVTAPVVFLVVVLVDDHDQFLDEVVERAASITAGVALLAFTVGALLVWRLDRRLRK